MMEGETLPVIGGEQFFYDDVIAELQKPLDPKHVKQAPPGKYGSYVDAYHVISEANRIFGHGGWSYTVQRLEMVSEQTVEGKNGLQYRVGYMATVRAEVGGVSREGCSVGSGMGNPDTMADHHESAVKEAETDALKRALRSFGNTFGLALYDKEQANVRAPDVPREPRAVADSLIKLIGQQADENSLNALIGGAKFDAAWLWLKEEKPAMEAEVSAALKGKRDEVAA